MTDSRSSDYVRATAFDAWFASSPTRGHAWLDELLDGSATIPGIAEREGLTRAAVFGAIRRAMRMDQTVLEAEERMA